MPMLKSTAGTPKEAAIVGSAVAIAVPSKFSMKNATATIRGTILPDGRVVAGRLQRLRVSASAGNDCMGVSAYGRAGVQSPRPQITPIRRYATRRRDLILAPRHSLLYPCAHVGLRSGSCNNF